MKLRMFLCFILMIMQSFSLFADDSSTIGPKFQAQLCVAYEYEEPYQFLDDKGGVNVYKGLDIDILDEVLDAHTIVTFKHLQWADGLQALKDGTCDIVAGAFYDKSRKEYAYYSTPYRYTEDMFYHLKTNKFNYDSVDHFINSEQIHQIKIGVIKNAKYTSEALNEYMRQHPENFIFASSDRELVKLASEKKIQGFFADKTQMELLLWRTGFHSILTAAPMQLTRIPVYYLMSKKTIQPEFVDWFDKRLQALVKSSDYTTMVRKYSVPLFIAMTTDTLSYHILEILGTMFYAISGLILAKEARFSLTGAFILAMLPGIGGGLMRDIMLDRDPVGVLRTPSYFMTVVATTLVFYTFIRVRQYIKSLHKISDFFHDHMFVKEFSIVRATDAVGLAVFTIIGVMVAVEVQATPLWLWGPIIAVLSSTGGGIVRDFFLGRELNRTFFYETAFIWSFLLTAYIIIRTESISPDEIFYAILVTLVGIISTRIFILKKGWLTKEFWLE